MKTFSFFLELMVWEKQQFCRILLMLFMSLQKNPLIFCHQKRQNKQNKYYRVSSNLYSLDKSKASIVYMRFREEDGTNRDYIDVRGNCTHDQYNQQISLEGKIQFDAFRHSLEEEGNVKYWDVSDSKSIKNIFGSNILTYFPAYRYEVPSYLNEPYKINISCSIANRFSGFLNNPIEVTSDLSGIANWIMDVVLDNTVYPKETQELLNQINKVLSNILISKTGFKTRFGLGPRSSGLERIAVIKTGKNEELLYPSIFNMSSGELALLCLFGELVKQADKNFKTISSTTGIVLIDEIEKHLHIQLQKEIVPKLVRLFPNIQFIISSHSPFFALGLQDEPGIEYSLIDLEKNGAKSFPDNTEIFRQVYDMMISENEKFALKCDELQARIAQGTRPIILTEGKTDWKHLKAAQKKLGINDIDIEFGEYETDMGDSVLYTFLQNCAKFPQTRPIIGMFDRDYDKSFKYKDLGESLYRRISMNVYAFSIPLVHEKEYGDKISIEHYYNRLDLCKEDEHGRRMFLGDEFLDCGNSRDGKFQTRISDTQMKIQKNGVIDEKVYKRDDLAQEHSVAMSKSCFAQRIYDEDLFAKDFDMSAFAKIFEVIRAILKDIHDKSNGNGEFLHEGEC